MLKVLTGLLFLTGWAASAFTHNVMHSVSEIKSFVSSTDLVEIPTARLVYVNYELLAHDFSELRKQSNETNGQWRSRLDRWLLARSNYFRKQHFLNLGVIMESKEQPFGLKKTTESVPEWHNRVKEFVKQNGRGFYDWVVAQGNRVNSFVAPNWENMAKGFLPGYYNRAHLMPVENGILDIKGSGTNHPSGRKKSSGLLPLNEAIREVIMEKSVQKILQHAGSDIKTVGNYGVIDWGFNIIYENGAELPAGAVIRQASLREYSEKNSQLPKLVQVEVESILRRYGLTSTGDSLALNLKHSEVNIAINIQGSTRNDIIDFGHITAFNENDFEGKKAFTLGEPYKLDITAAESTEKLASKFDPSMRVPPIFFQTSNETDPINDGPFIYSRDLAWSLRANFDRQHVEDHIRNFLRPLDTVLKSSTSGWFRGSSACGRFYLY